MEEMVFYNKQDELLRQHAEIEMRALGYMLMNDEIAIIGCKALSEKYFVYPINEYIFKVIKHHIHNNEVVEKIQTILLSIHDTDWKELIPDQNLDGKKYIRSLFIINLDFLNKGFADQIFATVKDQYVQRQIIKDHTQRINTILLTTSLSRGTADLLQDISANAEGLLDFVDQESTIDVKDMIYQVLHEKHLPKILTGYPPLDNLTGGFAPTNLVTIGGAPASGKSALALNIALNMCKNGVKVAFWSFEMNEQEISYRILAIRTSLSFSDSKPLDEEQYNAARQYLDNMQDQLRVSTDAIYNLDTFYLHCRNLKNKWGLQIVFIDYLQLIHLHQNFGSNRAKEITFITNMLKKFAQDLGIVIVILSQFSKEVTKRPDAIPCLADLKDSSSIEQDSNIVILLYNPPDAAISYQGNYIDIILAKNRSGKKGKIALYFSGNLTKFTE